MTALNCQRKLNQKQNKKVQISKKKTNKIVIGVKKILNCTRIS